MLNEEPGDQDWNAWDLEKVQRMGQSYYKRGTGELPEKESSKSLAAFMKAGRLYNAGDRFLDIGCAAGHFLRSLRERLDQGVRYTGIDTNMKYLQWGREAYGLGETCSFVQCDALHIPFHDSTFDTVFVNLFHFFPRIDLALGEAMRLGRRRVIWRTPIGETNYMVKVVYDNSFKKIGPLSPDRTDVNHSLNMIYSEEYIRGLVEHLGASVASVERDADFESFDNNEVDGFECVPATRVVAGMQINGILLMDWHYVVIDLPTKKDAPRQRRNK